MNLAVIVMMLSVILNSVAKADLVGHWTFDEGSGAVANDASGNENHGTVGGVEWVEGTLGGALEFNGSSGPGVEIPHNPSLKLINEGDFTLTAWFKPREIPTSNRVVIQQGDLNGTGRTWLYYQSSTSNIATFIGGGATLSGADMEVETWVHAALVITEEGGTDSIQLYVNGEAAGDGGRFGMEDSVGDYFIGRHKYSNNNVYPTMRFLAGRPAISRGPHQWTHRLPG